MAASGESTRSIPLSAFVTRALVDLVPLGLTSAPSPTADAGGAIRLRISTANVPPPIGEAQAERHSLGAMLEQVCHVSGLFSLRAPGAPQPLEQRARWGGPGAWGRMEEMLGRDRTLLLSICMSRAEWEAFTRRRAELVLSATGFSIVQEVWLEAGRCEAWLTASERVGPPAEGERIAALLSGLLRAHGAPPVTVTLVHAAPPTLNPYKQPHFEATFEVAPRPPVAVSNWQLVELQKSLERAAKEAPRGFVALKVFRDRLLPSSLSPEERQAQIDAALDAGIARIREVTDPKTGNIVKALELVQDRRLVGTPEA